MKLSTYLYLAASVITFCLGEYFSKKLAQAVSVEVILLAVLCYVVGSCLWFPVIIQTNTLAVTGTIWSLLAAVGTVLIGLSFGETITTVQQIGLFTALVSIILLSM